MNPAETPADSGKKIKPPIPLIKGFQYYLSHVIILHICITNLYIYEVYTYEEA